MDFESWLLFCSIAFVATLSPGPAILLVTTHSLQYGPMRSLFTILGNITGLLIMSACSVLGLNTLLLYSVTAFTCIKFFGAAYLIYIGIKLWRKGIMVNEQLVGTQEKFSPFKLYSQGVIIALTNPKAIVFTTALFPQFIDVAKPLLVQFSILVFSFMGLSAICLFAYAVISYKAKTHSSRFFSGTRIGKVFGATFVGAGLMLATTVHN